MRLLEKVHDRNEQGQIGDRKSVALERLYAADGALGTTGDREALTALIGLFIEEKDEDLRAVVIGHLVDARDQLDLKRLQAARRSVRAAIQWVHLLW